MHRRNVDESLRKLERASQSGDLNAVRRLAHTSQKTQEPPLLVLGIEPGVLSHPEDFESFEDFDDEGHLYLAELYPFFFKEFTDIFPFVIINPDWDITTYLFPMPHIPQVGSHISYDMSEELVKRLRQPRARGRYKLFGREYLYLVVTKTEFIPSQNIVIIHCDLVSDIGD